MGEKILEEAVMLLDDFNEHLGYVGEQENVNGKMVNEWIWNYNLLLLNVDSKCSGTYSWSRGNQKVLLILFW